MKHQSDGRDRMSHIKRMIGVGVTAGLLALPLQQALAHGGGLDRHGCHRETATGGYHCHRNKEDDIDWALVAGVAGGALVLWLLIDVLKDDNPSASSLIQIVPYAVDENRLGIAAEYSLGPAGAIGLRTTTQIGEDRKQGRMGAYWQLRF